MNRIMISERQQGFLFSQHYTSDYLDEDDEVFLFDRLIDSLDLSSIYNSYSSEGGKTYEPRDIFGLIAYGFMKGITSSRKLAESTRYNIRFIHLSGNRKPSYRCILNFKAKHRDAIEQLFVLSVERAIDCGMIDHDEVFALDGTKLKAYASVSKSKTKKKWKERRDRLLLSVQEYLDECERVDHEEDETFGELDEKRKAIYDKVLSKLEDLNQKNTSSTSKSPSTESYSANDEENSDSTEEPEPPSNSRRPKIDSLGEANKALSECSQIDSLLESQASADSDKRLNLTDPTSGLMKSDGNIKPRYNAQCLSNNHIIIAADLVNEENDQGQLQPMLENLKKNLSLDEKDDTEDNDNLNSNEVKEKPDEAYEELTESEASESIESQPEEKSDSDITTVVDSEAATDIDESIEDGRNKIKLTADAGYNAGANLEYLDKEENIDAYVSMNRRDEDNLNEDEKKFHKNNFEYDEDSDEYICPNGKRLENYGERINGSRQETIYVSNLETCQGCSFFSKCVQTKDDQKKGYRTIIDDGFNLYRKEMKTKMQEPESRNIYRKRSGAVEGIFGQMKANKGISGFAYRGLQKFRAEFFMLCFSHNLEKIMRYGSKKAAFSC